MSNEFYAPGEQRAAKVNDLFGAIAGRYDLINDLQSFGLHRRWKQRAVALAQVKPGSPVLDLCCGTGDIAFAMASKGATVTGLDFSQAMLDVAEKRKAAQNQKSETRNPKFVQGDAMHLPFPDASFEAVTIGYGLRNLSSFETGLREMQRVAQPGGRLVVLEFGKPANALWRALYLGYLRFAVPLMGLIFCGNASAYAYILESLKHYPGQEGVAAKMRELGLVNVRVVNLLGGAMSLNYGEKAGGRGRQVSSNRLVIDLLSKLLDGRISSREALEVWPDINDPTLDKLAHNAWHSLYHFENDDDIRAKEPAYEARQKAGLQAILDKLKRSEA